MLATSVTGEESLISFGEEAAMQTKLASVLTILSVALTAVAVAVFAVGPFAAIAIALISATSRIPRCRSSLSSFWSWIASRLLFDNPTL